MANTRYDSDCFSLDGVDVEFQSGETILQAATRAGRFIPHLCSRPGFHPGASCRLCVVKVNGRHASACTLKATAGLEVESRTSELDHHRRTLLRMLFIEGNHFCPSCEKSGDCLLQATAYQLEMRGPRFEEFYPNRQVDATHPDILLDFNRCILCGLCVQASQDVDGKNIFAIGGYGIDSHLIVNSESGKLGDTNMALTDRAAHVCPVGVILPKRVGFAVPIGERTYDAQPLASMAEEKAS